MPSNQLFDAVGKGLNFIAYREQKRDWLAVTSADKNNLSCHELINDLPVSP
jgi:hypothetical protein